MKLIVILESRNFDDDEILKQMLDESTCDLCFLGQGPMCADRSVCRLKSHREIFVKESITPKNKEVER